MTMMRTDHVLADSRSSQELEPLRVPAKLQDRFERAHKRMANKDGFLFTSAATPPRESAKKNLPEVILRNKMMAFESKWQCTSKTSMLYDPLDTSFERLSMDEREEVMNRIQTRVEHITEAVEDKYRRKKQELDDQGVFDAAINARRVQTMYLVELQRRCNIDQLKNQVLQEFDQERQPLFAGSFGQKAASNSAPVHVLGTLLQDAEPPLHELKGSKKLQRLLRSNSIAKSSSEHVLERRKSVRSSSIASSIATKTTPTPATLPANAPAAPTAPTNNPPPGRSSQPDNNPQHVAMSRHPEIASVVAALRAAEVDAKLVKKRSKVPFRPGQDMAAKLNNSVDEWKDQVDLFGQIGARCCASLRRRTTSHLADFSAPAPSFAQLWSRVAPLAANLRETRRAKTKSTMAAGRPSDPNQPSSDNGADERLSTRKAAATAQYSEWQDAIGRRRKHAKQFSDSASVVSTGVAHPAATTATLSQPDASTASSLPPALQRRPSTILNERQNKHARRQPSGAIGKVGGRPRAVAPVLEHTAKRVLRRQVTSITWEWQTLEPTKAPVHPGSSKSLTPPPTSGDDTAPASSGRSQEKNSPHRSSMVSQNRNNSVVDSHELLQRRLEEVWLRLGMPYHLKLNMLQKYASHDGAEALHSAINLWEIAAEVVVVRETLLMMGTHAQGDLVPDELDMYWTQLQAYEHLLPIPSEMPPMHAFGSWVDSLVPIATTKCRDAIGALTRATGDVLTYDGVVYLVDEVEGNG